MWNPLPREAGTDACCRAEGLQRRKASSPFCLEGKQIQHKDFFARESKLCVCVRDLGLETIFPRTQPSGRKKKKEMFNSPYSLQSLPYVKQLRFGSSQYVPLSQHSLWDFNWFWLSFEAHAKHSLLLSPAACCWNQHDSEAVLLAFCKLLNLLVPLCFFVSTVNALLRVF